MNGIEIARRGYFFLFAGYYVGEARILKKEII
jgi:hypothetical protein